MAMRKCVNCKHCDKQEHEYPCTDCNHFDKWESLAPQWISVEDRLPEEPCAVLVFLCGSVVGVAWYNYTGWFETGSGIRFRAGNGVTHWMPLPEPPEEEE